jgi:hypothetical protein
MYFVYIVYMKVNWLRVKIVTIREGFCCSILSQEFCVASFIYFLEVEDMNFARELI